MLPLIEFFDAAFLRLVWALLVDYLIASGFLFPEQRQVWVEGYVHILNAIGSIIFIAIWLHHANKKETVKNLQTTTTQVTTSNGALSGLLSGLKNFVIKEKTTTVTEPVNPDRLR